MKVSNDLVEGGGGGGKMQSNPSSAGLFAIHNFIFCAPFNV